jgi:hypothetical protein
VASDVAGAADPLTYTINWGDGSAVQNLTAAELAAVAGNVAHTFADDQDGPANATLRTISVTVNDGDGGSNLQTKLSRSTMSRRPSHSVARRRSKPARPTR